MILQQLEEDDSSSNLGESQKLDVERIVASTNEEIARRDREIEELRSIVEQQSDTRQGVAIGAAAIAQMLDSDELVSQERQKLKDIQHEWEEKLRQAEIDLSMERAKLARERLELEAQRERAVEDQPDPHEQDEDGEKGRTRKWLVHLGLRDEQP